MITHYWKMFHIKYFGWEKTNKISRTKVKNTNRKSKKNMRVYNNWANVNYRKKNGEFALHKVAFSKKSLNVRHIPSVLSFLQQYSPDIIMKYLEWRTNNCSDITCQLISCLCPMCRRLQKLLWQRLDKEGQLSRTDLPRNVSAVKEYQRGAEWEPGQQVLCSWLKSFFDESCKGIYRLFL